MDLSAAATKGGDSTGSRREFHASCPGYIKPRVGGGCKRGGGLELHPKKNLLMDKWDQSRGFGQRGRIKRRSSMLGVSQGGT